MGADTRRARAFREGELDVPLGAEATLALFTPEGERAWIEGWAPRYLEGGTPPLAEGLVFETDKGGAIATWIVARYEPDQGRAAYAYVLPGQWATLVDVTVEPVDPSRSRVLFRYHMTALTPDADASVHAFGEGFGSLQQEWQQTLGRLKFAEATPGR